MKRSIGLLTILFVLAAQLLVLPAAASSLAPVLHGSGRLVADQYIVVLKDGANPRAVAAVAGVTPKYVYEAALNGFAAVLNAGQMNALRHNPNVAYIEQDQAITADAVINGPTRSWGLDRIDQRTLPLNGQYNVTATAPGVYAYIINTGIQTSHPEFGGRAANVYDAFGGTGNDCHGLGTHLAGIVGSTTWGVAKGVRLRGVRVIDCNGSGTYSGIIAGIEWVRANRINPAVANIGLTLAPTSSLNTAVTNLANSGVFTAVAAGNSNADACGYSPANVSNVLAVAASNSADYRASFSNYGPCVDLYAPGVSITSTWPGGSNTLSGTWQASAFVTGVGALYKATFGDAASSTVNSWIIANATPGVIMGNPPDTPNRLLYVGGL